MIAGIARSGLTRGEGTCRHAGGARPRPARARTERPPQEQACRSEAPPRSARAPLDDIERPPAPLPAPARAAAAARAFAAGNGYLTGLLVDRTI
jgi:hypothetical protein